MDSTSAAKEQADVSDGLAAGRRNLSMSGGGCSGSPTRLASAEGISSGADVGPGIRELVAPQVLHVALGDDADIHVASAPEIVEYAGAYGLAHEAYSFRSLKRAGSSASLGTR